ncbi:MAG: glycosyltransferase [Candidatus Tumulicola sp.]
MARRRSIKLPSSAAAPNNDVSYFDVSDPLAKAFAEAVDSEFYEFVYGKLAPGTSAASHYATVGWREGRDPNPWFCSRAYSERHPEVAESGVVPLFYFLEHSASTEELAPPCEHAKAYYARRPARDSAIDDDNRIDSEDSGHDAELNEQCRAIRDSFDAEYYLAMNPEVAETRIDPLLHFVQQGWQEGRNPNAWFSITAYLESYPDIGQAGLNPFYHYLVSGRAEGRESSVPRETFDASYYLQTNPDVARTGVNPLAHFIARGWWQGRAPNSSGRADFLKNETLAMRRRGRDGSNYEYVLDALEKVGKVSIIVPIHNAFDKVQICVEAIFRNTTYPAELLLIDDASTDREGAQLLESYEGVPGVRVLRNEKNLGFSGTVNRGIRESRCNVVLLNSDTSVGPHWLENMIFAACQRPSIGTVTAISNSAGVFGVIPDGSRIWDIGSDQRDAISRLAMQHSHLFLLETPTGNGFCMFMKRSMTEQVGYFDSDTFPRGYGEENDYCMRALHAGWEHVIDDATFVFHAETASFSSETRRALSETGLENVKNLHPEYLSHVDRFINGPRLAVVRKWAADLPILPVLQGERQVRPRVLYVVHGCGLDDTMEFCLDLVRDMGDAIDAYILSSSGSRLSLYGVEGGQLKPMDSRDLTNRAIITDIRNADYRNAIYEVLSQHHFELVHVHDLMYHSLDILDVTKLLHLPVVVTCHDYYLLCPNHLLLDDEFVFCDGICTSGEGSCRHQSVWLRDAPPLKHHWVHTWRRRVTEALRHVDAVTMPSHDSQERYLRLLPDLKELQVVTIEHGVDLPRAQVARAPVPGGKVRILFPCYIANHEGIDVIRKLHEADGEGRLEFHFMGDTPKAAEGYGVNHGEYRRRDFIDRAAAIKPAFVGIFSIQAETFCYVLSEAWSAGIPVIGTRLGAIGESIMRDGGGWALDLGDIAVLYRTILAIADDTQEYHRGMAAAQAAKVKSVHEMEADYLGLYDRVMDRRAAFRPSRPASMEFAAPL